MAKLKIAQAILPLILFLIGGILNSLLTKLILEVTSPGTEQYGEHKFQKPYFVTFLGFFGMSLATAIYCFGTCFNSEKFPSIFKELTFRQFCIYSIPSFADVFQGIVSTITVAFVGVSIDCMMKSATLIGVTLIARFYFKQPIMGHQWFATGIISISLIIVGASSIINSGQSQSIHVDQGGDLLIIFIKLISQLLYAVKISFEEFLTQQQNHHELLVTGIEGIWSTIFCIISVIAVHFIPGKDGNGTHEDFIDTITMFKNSPMIIILSVVLIVIGLVYNINSIILIAKTSAIIRTLAESFRTFLIWILQIILFYWFSSSDNLSEYKGIGEQWLTGSYLQLFGFLMLTFGIIQHHGYPKLPCFNYEIDVSEQGLDQELIPDNEQTAPIDNMLNRRDKKINEKFSDNEMEEIPSEEREPFYT
ncbi:putative integral membrane protein [Histomonas meleagridis]|uniref:putative integral membrane protein n=1 Tax=Histomonas meleagridis TaxID=135588 RepID=UPI0035598356|nr:putative integral membrane protein [Histomonas meleagridis]KAH0806759.1 putative integral membrane protein [Histomonas meleagridis]